MNSKEFETKKLRSCLESKKGIKSISYFDHIIGFIDALPERLKRYGMEKNREVFYAQARVLVKRWVVERTFSWINNARRLAKDFEILTCSTENYVRIAIIQIMLDRLR